MTKPKRDIIDLYAEKAKREAQEIADYEDMLELLCGYRINNGRQSTARYPEKGSVRERQARAALAQYVNRKIPGFVGHLLALAIDPQMQPNPGMKRTRVVKFESPRRGHNVEWARHLQIVGEIWRGLGDQASKLKPGGRVVLERELKKAGDRHSLEREAVYKIWMAHPLAQSWATYFKARTKTK